MMSALLTHPGLPLGVPGHSDPGVALLPLHSQEAALEHQVVPQVPRHELGAHPVASDVGARRLLDTVPEMITYNFIKINSSFIEFNMTVNIGRTI